MSWLMMGLGCLQLGSKLDSSPRTDDSNEERADTAEPDTAGTEDTADTGDTGDWWNEGGDDVDGDGWTTEDGDCDDLDDAVHPGASDDCDGADEDCDGAVDEDFGDDPYEPNDEAALDIGEFGTEGEELIYGYVFPEADLDRFSFHVEDGDWEWFSLEIWLYDVPAEADYALELVWIEDMDGDYRGIVATADDEGEGGQELIDHDGSSGWDDTGWYEVVVRSNGGEACAAPYQLQILVGSW